MKKLAGVALPWLPRDTADLGLPGGSGYAAIGPFAAWRIIVREAANPGLDLTSPNTIVVVIHGFHQTFDD